jgi:hypothetical protein
MIGRRVGSSFRFFAASIHLGQDRRVIGDSGNSLNTFD